MTANYKVGGIWKQTTPYVNVGGTWKIAKSAWANLNSSWKSWFLQGGLNDGGFTTFDVYNGLNGTVNAVAIQSDGKLILVGAFTTFNGLPVGRVARINTNGTLDTAFTTNTGTGANNTINAVAIQSDGKIVLGGVLDLSVGSPTANFSTWNGATVNRIVRLNSDGTRDTAFTTNTNAGASASGLITGAYGIFSIKIQSDGKILVGGGFLTFNGTTVNRIVRLNADGTRDTAFTTNTGAGANNGIFTIAIQSDNKIVLGGAFTTFSGATVNRIVRLNTDGTRDTAFTTGAGTGAPATVNAVAIQSDQKIILVGQFTTFNGVTVNRIVRLNTDGTRDTAFTTNTGAGANNIVYAVAIQSDGKIVLGGAFTTFNGVTVTRIARLNLDGTLNTAFTTNTGTGANDTINAVAIQSDGKFVLGGSFTTFNGVTVNRIVRLNSDGTRDTSISVNSGFNNVVSAVAIQSDGKIVLGGTFTGFNETTINRIARLNLDGTLDTAFTTNIGTGASDNVLTIAIQSDQKIVLGGTFTTFNGVTVNRIVRLNSDGTRDTAFTTNTGAGANNIVYAVAIQSDGKFVLGGSFTTFNGVTVNRIVRLNTDGTTDTAFTTNTGTGASSNIFAIALQSDGKILVGGGFGGFNGITVNRIVRLNADGTRDTAFTTNTGAGAGNSVFTIQIQSDGKILVGGGFISFNGATANRIVRLNADGTRDTAFTTNTGTAANNIINAIAIQSDGKILVGGQFLNFNNVTVNRIVRLNTDGTTDTAFTTNTGTGASSTVFAIAIQSDGKIVLGGSFTGFSSTPRSQLARIGGDIAQ